MMRLISCLGFTALILLTTMARAQGASLDGERLIAKVDDKWIILSMPDGFCRVAPNGTSAEQEILQRFKPPLGRNAILLALGVDCATRKILKEGNLHRMRRLLSLSLLTNANLPVGEAFLADRFRHFQAREPLTERYWQSPSVSGSPAVKRDERAVYLAHRHVKNGTVTLSGVSAYATIENLPLIVSVLSFDGSDVSMATVAETARIVSMTVVKPGR